MRELNQVIYNAIKTDATYRTYAGATSTDPRVYKQRTPAKVTCSTAKPAYCVYGIMGSSKPPDYIHGAQKNNYAYRLEVYALTDTRLAEICERLETLFEDKTYTTTTYIVGYVFASRGVESFDGGREEYTETITIYMNNVYVK